MTVAPGARQGSQWVAFAAGLKRDGFILVEDEDQRMFQLHRMLPEVADLPNASNEVHMHLERNEFVVPLGHLNQAINAHSRGEWASANAQMRTFLEGLLEVELILGQYKLSAACRYRSGRRSGRCLAPYPIRVPARGVRKPGLPGSRSGPTGS